MKMPKEYPSLEDVMKDYRAFKRAYEKVLFDVPDVRTEKDLYDDLSKTAPYIELKMKSAKFSDVRFLPMDDCDAYVFDKTILVSDFYSKMPETADYYLMSAYSVQIYHVLLHELIHTAKDKSNESVIYDFARAWWTLLPYTKTIDNETITEINSLEVGALMSDCGHAYMEAAFYFRLMCYTSSLVCYHVLSGRDRFVRVDEKTGEHVLDMNDELKDVFYMGASVLSRADKRFRKARGKGLEYAVMHPRRLGYLLKSPNTPTDNARIYHIEPYILLRRAMEEGVNTVKYKDMLKDVSIPVSEAGKLWRRAKSS